MYNVLTWLHTTTNRNASIHPDSLILVVSLLFSSFSFSFCYVDWCSMGCVLMCLCLPLGMLTLPLLVSWPPRPMVSCIAFLSSSQHTIHQRCDHHHHHDYYHHHHHHHHRHCHHHHHHYYYHHHHQYHYHIITITTIMIIIVTTKQENGQTCMHDMTSNCSALIVVHITWATWCKQTNKQTTRFFVSSSVSIPCCWLFLFFSFDHVILCDVTWRDVTWCAVVVVAVGHSLGSCQHSWGGGHVACEMQHWYDIIGIALLS